MRRIWQGIPRDVRHAVALGTFAEFGSEGTVITYVACALVYEGLRWLVERDVERVRRGLSEHYGIELRR